MLNTNRSNSSSRTGFAPTYFEYHGVDPGAYYGLAYRQVNSWFYYMNSKTL